MIDRVYMKYWNPKAYKVINLACFAHPLNSMGKNWNIYKPNALGVYYPKICINRYPERNNLNRIIAVLEVDCNLPKLCYGSNNNLYELTNKDLVSVRMELCNRLFNMGVELDPLQVHNGDMKSVEFGKNIVTGNIPVSFILEEMCKAKRLNNYMDVQRTTFRNGGEELSFYNQGIDIALYDKAAEMKAALVNNPDLLPTALTNRILGGKLNVLRMEVRFHNHDVLDNFLQTHKLATNTRLQDVFSQDISKYVLNYYWHELSKTARLISPSVFSSQFELQQIHSGAGISLGTQQILAKGKVRDLLREYGHKGTTNALKRIGCTNPSQILRTYVSRAFKLPRALDIWRFMDRALSTFKLLTPVAWQNVKMRAAAPWYKKAEQLLTTSEVAQWLNVCVETVRRLIKNGELAAKLIGNQYRMNRQDVLAYLYGHNG